MRVYSTNGSNIVVGYVSKLHLGKLRLATLGEDSPKSSRVFHYDPELPSLNL